MVIYHLEIPRIHKRNRVKKSKLLAMWLSNHKSWCTIKFIVELVHETCGPQVKEYIKKSSCH